MEKNPNHATTQALHSQWHAIALMLMAKLGMDHVVITVEDVRKMAASNKKNIVVQELKDGMHLRLVTDEEGDRLAKKEGGLPH